MCIRDRSNTVMTKELSTQRFGAFLCKLLSLLHALLCEEASDTLSASTVRSLPRLFHVPSITGGHMAQTPFVELIVLTCLLPASPANALSGLASMITQAEAAMTSLLNPPQDSSSSSELHCKTIPELATQTEQLPRNQRARFLGELPRRVAEVVTQEFSDDSASQLHTMPMSALLERVAQSTEPDRLIHSLPSRLAMCVQQQLEGESTLEQLMRARLEEEEDDDGTMGSSAHTLHAQDTQDLCLQPHTGDFAVQIESAQQSSSSDIFGKSSEDLSSSQIYHMLAGSINEPVSFNTTSSFTGDSQAVLSALQQEVGAGVDAQQFGALLERAELKMKASLSRVVIAQAFGELADESERVPCAALVSVGSHFGLAPAEAQHTPEAPLDLEGFIQFIADLCDPSQPSRTVGAGMRWLLKLGTVSGCTSNMQRVCVMEEGGGCVGMVRAPEGSTFKELRGQIEEQLEALPESFRFVLEGGAMLGIKQEHEESISNFNPPGQQRRPSWAERAVLIKSTATPQPPAPASAPERPSLDMSLVQLPAQPPAQQAAAAQPSAPTHWHESHDADGKEFYWNDETREVRSDEPPAPAPAEEESASAPVESAPAAAPPASAPKKLSLDMSLVQQPAPTAKQGSDVSPAAQPAPEQPSLDANLVQPAVAQLPAQPPAQQAAAAQPSAPTHWHESHDADGKEFYWNDETREVRSDEPPAPAEEESASAPPEEAVAAPAVQEAAPPPASAPKKPSVPKKRPKTARKPTPTRPKAPLASTAHAPCSRAELATPCSSTHKRRVSAEAVQNLARECRRVSAFMGCEVKQLSRLQPSQHTHKEASAVDSILALIAAAQTLKQEDAMRGLSCMQHTTLPAQHTEQHTELELQSLHRSASAEGLATEVPSGHLWEVSSQLSKLRREAGVISRAQQDLTDQQLETTAQRISCSMVWEAKDSWTGSTL
eukprot:TRINITY_DN5169_c0_g1_i1.p1 TRINITY_DN5169_c0_g1~~TRINITY_DN5169_c0_g1_i1.p1  ORF type:complete len:944 (-),score=264.47 TRINITY_DN5169_c0_g1_i1:186-3017(-)